MGFNFGDIVTGAATLFGGPVAGIGAGILGGMFQDNATNRANRASADQAEISRDFNEVEAQRNRDFQERMSSTAHQREVEDLRLAGLNPILSASRGSSTPAGSSATSTAAPQHLSSGVASANESYRAALEGQRTRQDMAIKAPLEKVAGGASSVIDRVTENIPSWADGLSQLVSSVQDAIPHVSGASARAVEDLVNNVSHVGTQLSEVLGDAIDVPKKVLEQGQSSARRVVEDVKSHASKAYESVRNAYKAPADAINGPSGVAPNATRGKLRGVVPEVDTRRNPKSGFFSNDYYHR